MCDKCNEPSGAGTAQLRQATQGDTYGATQSINVTKHGRDMIIQRMMMAAHDMEKQAQGLRRLVKIVAALGEHDNEVYAAIEALLRGRN